MAVPPGIGHMEDVSIREFDRNVRIRVGWRIVFERERRAIEMERFLASEQLCRQGTGRRGWKGKIPAFNSCGRGKMFPCVLVRGDFSAHGMKPLVAVRVIEMPVRIDQMLDRVRAETGERFGDSRP